MSNFVKGILSNFVSKTLVAGIGLLTVILVSRSLGPQGRGEIGLFMSSVALLQLICDFGNNTGIINLSYKHAQRTLWNSSLIWITGVCILAWPLIGTLTSLPFRWYIAPAAWLYSLVNLHHLLLMGKQEVHKRNLSLLVVPVTLLILFWLLSQILGSNTGHYIVAFFVALLISVVISYKLIAPSLQLTESTFVFESEVLKSGIWIQSAQAIQFLNYRLNFFLVAFLISDAALGVYNNAVILCESIWIIGHSMAQMQHMKILNTLEPAKHVHITQKVMKFNFMFTTVALIILMLIPDIFWNTLFGEGFEQVRPLFLNLSAGVLAFSISNIISHGLHATNKFKTILLCNLTGLISGFVSAWILIPDYGIKGAADAWSLGLFVSMLAYVLVYYRQNIAYLNVGTHRVSVIFSVLIAAILSYYLSNSNMQFPVYEWAQPSLALYIGFFTLFAIGLYFSILGIINSFFKSETTDIQP